MGRTHLIRGFGDERKDIIIVHVSIVVHIIGLWEADEIPKISRKQRFTNFTSLV